ncbi:MAG: gliding motility-associated C-terminal domain-containing protein [Bacteroidetes bacterium]|nr:gliding motility-associated C-terminal domain-containing protein [Bacteroidota bacterium]
MKIVKTLFYTFAAIWMATSGSEVFAQPCTTLGQTPQTAFPVCGTSVFRQSTVPICRNGDMVVPGCASADGYGDKNPFYYKFTCYVGGTLGFMITPLAANEDYDWQLYDITGRNLATIYTDPTAVVTGNWSGTYGTTGTSATGSTSIQCASVPADNRPTFSFWPTLIAGHEYLLMISHFSDGQSGYDLAFGGGTAVITDPKIPGMVSVKPDCDGKTLTLKLNKKVKCNSLSAGGTEFSILPAVTTVVSAVPDSCAFAFDFDDIVITLASPLPNGNYQLVINPGTDGNTLKDNCDNLIPTGEAIPFYYAIPQPIFADSIGKPGCAPDSVKIYFPKKIICNTIAPNGSDFSVTGPSPVTVISANGNCVNNKTDYVVVRFASPITVGGTYTLTLKAGDDGTVIIDECGIETPIQTLNFITVDTVNADFTYTQKLGCRSDTLTFSHNGAHGVNSWSWLFNGQTPPITTQTHTIVWPATSDNTAQLIVNNGVCKDTSSQQIKLSNEVKAAFSMDNIICPEDGLKVTNQSEGQIDAWLWKYDVVGTSNLKDPPPFLFPTLYREAYYTVKLNVFNTALNCTDSTRKTLTVLDFCLIEVPTAFTPNNDGLNDYFQPHNALKADNYEFKIYNRWGQLVFQSRNWREKWDGRVNGELQTTGVYVWMLNYVHRDTKQSVFRKGTVTLIR